MQLSRGLLNTIAGTMVGMQHSNSVWLVAAIVAVLIAPSSLGRGGERSPAGTSAPSADRGARAKAPRTAEPQASGSTAPKPQSPPPTAAVDPPKTTAPEVVLPPSEADAIATRAKKAAAALGGAKTPDARLKVARQSFKAAAVAADAERSLLAFWHSRDTIDALRAVHTGHGQAGNRGALRLGPWRPKGAGAEVLPNIRSVVLVDGGRLLVTGGYDPPVHNSTSVSFAEHFRVPTAALA